MPNPAENPVVPRPLKVAAVACFIEAAVFAVLFAIQLGAFSLDRAMLGWSTATFFAIWGVMLAGCSAAVLRRQSWARSPLVLAQLIQLGLAFSLATDDHSDRMDHTVAWLIAAVSLVVLMGIFRRTSLEFLAPVEG